MADDLDNIIAGISSEMPSASAPIVEGVAERVEDVGPKDREGLGFDPSIHKTDPSGNPVLNADGTLRRKRGRKAGSMGSSVGQAGAEPQGPSDPPHYAKLGAVSATMLTSACVGIFGEDWLPKIDPVSKQNERDYLAGAFAEYYKAKGIQDLPPGAALAMALSFYAFPRVTTSAPTKAKLKVLWEGLKNMFRRKRPKEPEQQA